MKKYKLIIDKARCIECGVSTGQCPTHAKTLSQLLDQNMEDVGIGVFSEDKYDRVKQLVKGCPAEAIVIKKIK